MYLPITGTGDGSAPVVNLTWPFLKKDHVKASAGDVEQSFTWTGVSQITFDDAVPADTPWRVYRQTDRDPMVDFEDGSVLAEEDLDTAAQQALYRVDELEGETSQALRAPGGEVVEPLPSASSRVLKLLGFDASGLRELVTSTVLASRLLSPLVPLLTPYLGENPTVNVKVGFGAAGDGETNDQAAFQAAIDAVHGVGGGTVKVPSGTYIMGLPVAGSTAVRVKDGVELVGEGPSSIIQRQDDTGPLHLVVVDTDVLTGAVRNLVIDGNRDNNSTTGHGMRVSGTRRSFVLQNVIIRRTYSYGLGLQDGTHKGFKVDNLVIEDTGSDGLDIKNKGLAFLEATGTFSVGDVVVGLTSGASGTVSEIDGTTLTLDALAWDEATGEIYDFVIGEDLQVDGITVGTADSTLDRPDNEDIQLNNVSVRRWGLNDAETETQAAIDIRGPVALTNVWVSEPGANDSEGVRFRHGSELGVNGVGGHGASMTNFRIRMNSGTAQLGIRVGAHDVMLGAGEVREADIGIRVQGENLKAAQLAVKDSRLHGIQVDDDDVDGLNGGHGATFTDTRVTNATSSAIVVKGSRVTLLAVTSDGDRSRGLYIEPTADETTVAFGDYRGTTGAMILDQGTNSRFHQVRGFERTYAVADLATAIPSPVTGQKAFVNDATAATYGAAPTGGGAIKTPVYWNGAGWRMG